MLSIADIKARLELGGGHEGRLSIVPCPDLARALSRGGTSIDLRLGRWFRSFKQSRNSHFTLWTDEIESSGRSTLKTNEHFVRFGEDFILHPGRFVLGVTLEWLTLPSNLSGYVSGKSSLGRHGLVIETAAGLHPNFSGCLTLELANVGEVPLAISPGMEICQVFLHRTDGVFAKNPGAFSGQRKASISLPEIDTVFIKLRGKEEKAPIILPEVDGLDRE
jgi:dCTP deaminase